MFWHVVRFRFAAGVDDAERRRCEDGIHQLTDQWQTGSTVPAVKSSGSTSSPDDDADGFPHA